MGVGAPLLNCNYDTFSRYKYSETCLQHDIFLHKIHKRQSIVRPRKYPVDCIHWL